ncbi:MAG: hypothetical protein MMC33_006582 [Icmadophila ericetorum]|nr:hypothetical protein [Icmadophila ericetorum]
MDLLTPPPGGDQDRGLAVRIFYVAGSGICFTLLVLRFWARYRIRALGWDDWIMALAVAILIALATVGTIMTLKGGCKHIYYLLIEGGTGALVEVAYLFYICQPLAIMGIAVSRTSVAVLVLRILGPNSVWRKRFLWFSIASTLLISTLTSILLFVACKPVTGLWNPFIEADCWNPDIDTNLAIFASAWNVFMDVCLALIPVTIYWNLNLSLKKRIALCFLTGMGILAGISGTVKASKLYESIQLDFTWASYDLLMWNGVETILIIICGCLPTLKPLYDACLGHTGRTTRGSSSRVTGSTNRKKYFWYGSANSEQDESPSAIILETPRKSAAAASSQNEIRVAHRIDVDVSTRESGDSRENLHSGTASAAVPNWEGDHIQRPVYKSSWYTQERTPTRADDIV